MKWTNEKVINLIHLYQDRPVLWDCRLKGYKDRNKRMDALLEIAVWFGVGKEEIERKIKNLICHFSRELKKEKESIKSGAGNDDFYKSKWFCYNSMLFLKNRNRPRKIVDTAKRNQIRTEKVKIIQEESQNIDLIQNFLEYNDSTPEAGDKSNIIFRKSRNSIPGSHKTLEASVTEKVLSIENNFKGHNAMNDQYTAFGELVGMRIRDLPTSHAKKIVKHLISNLLFEAEIGKYDNPNSFTTSYSQPNLPQFSQPSFCSVTVPGSNLTSSPLLQKPCYSGRVPATYRPQQSVTSLTHSSDVEYADSDSMDSLMERK